MGTKQLSTEGVLNLLSNVKHNLESRQVILNLYFNPINPINNHKTHYSNLQFQSLPVQVLQVLAFTSSLITLERCFLE